MTRSWLGAALALVVVCAPARAHRLNVEARIEGSRVVVEVYFSDGTAPAGAEVVASRDGVEVARGLTDERGTWSFAPRDAGRHEIAVKEPGLHRGRAELDVRERDLAPMVPATIAPSASGSTAPITSQAPGSVAPRGGVDWLGLLAGLAIIAALVGGLSLWQRRGRAHERR